MFWLRNKKIKFPLRALNLSPGTFTIHYCNHQDYQDYLLYTLKIASTSNKISKSLKENDSYYCRFSVSDLMKVEFCLY